MFLALLPFVGWPVYKYLTLKKASPALIERTRKAVEKHPELKPGYDKAMEEVRGSNRSEMWAIQQSRCSPLGQALQGGRPAGVDTAQCHRDIFAGSCYGVAPRGPAFSHPGYREQVRFARSWPPSR
jgi:hypothetical protein